MLNGKFFTGLPPKMIERHTSSRNRLESHFFWPDDTKIDSAVETRTKRRTSLQLEPPQNLQQSQMQAQLASPTDDVDTKQMFQKEFTKSSIQFSDSLQEEPRRSGVGRTLKQGIAPKPTATKHELPETIIDEAYTAAKKKQVFNSKIEFYDFPDETLNNNRNKAWKPKMDMNDKKAMERNTKNSPKLQVKRDMRHISAQSQIDERDHFLEESKQPKSPPKTRRAPEPDYDRPQSRVRSPNKPIIRQVQLPPEEFSDFQFIDNSMSRLRLEKAPAPRRRVTYDDVPYGYDEYEDPHYRAYDLATRARRAPNMRAGSQREQRGTDDEYIEQANQSDYQYMANGNEPAPERWNNSSPSKTNSANNNNSNNNKSTNNDKTNANSQRSGSGNKKSNKEIASERESSPKSSSLAAAEEATNTKQKHLRSSLCFFDGAIIADDRGAAVQTPTSGQRRSARNSATQRVSVGLPESW